MKLESVRSEHGARGLPVGSGRLGVRVLGQAESVAGCGPRSLPESGSVTVLRPAGDGRWARAELAEVRVRVGGKSTGRVRGGGVSGWGGSGPGPGLAPRPGPGRPRPGSCNSVGFEPFPGCHEPLSIVTDNSTIWEMQR